MGIRVHKVIGYGLTDVKVEDGELADERINPKSPLLDNEERSPEREDYQADTKRPQ